MEKMTEKEINNKPPKNILINDLVELPKVRIFIPSNEDLQPRFSGLIEED